MGVFGAHALGKYPRPLPLLASCLLPCLLASEGGIWDRRPVPLRTGLEDLKEAGAGALL